MPSFARASPAVRCLPAAKSLPLITRPIAGMPAWCWPTSNNPRRVCGATMSQHEPFELRRGDLIWVSCDPSVGVEPKKTRTCVVVSNDIANRFGAVVTVVPTLRFTADRARREFIVDLRPPRSNLKEARVANASMVMTYDRSRIAGRAGRVHVDAMRALNRALMLHLGLGD